MKAKRKNARKDEKDAPPDHVTYNLVVCGSGAVGKSAITVRYIQGQFIERYDPTIEDSYLKHVELGGTAYTLDIMDTAGQENYRALTNSYMKKGDAFLLVFSVTSEESYDATRKILVGILETKGVQQERRGNEKDKDKKKEEDHEERMKMMETYPVCLVGNKIDLVEERRVPTYTPMEWAGKQGMHYRECSAKTGQGISSLFECLVLALRRRDAETRERARETRPKKRCNLM